MQLIDNENVYNKDKVQSGTVLAFDFGERRIGIAVGEHLIQSANPLTTIDNESNEVRFNTITALVNEWQPKLLVVGLPLSPTPMSISRAFMPISLYATRGRFFSLAIWRTNLRSSLHFLLFIISFQLLCCFKSELIKFPCLIRGASHV